MKNKIAVFMLATAVFAQAGLTALADDEPGSITPSGGPLTRSENPAWKICSFPFRIATGAGGMLIGAMVGGGKNVVTAEKQFSQNTFAHANQDPMLYPVGAVGSVIAVPVGFVTGMPEGAAAGGRYGYRIWDRL